MPSPATHRSEVQQEEGTSHALMAHTCKAAAVCGLPTDTDYDDHGGLDADDLREEDAQSAVVRGSSGASPSRDAVAILAKPEHSKQLVTNIVSSRDESTSFA